ncbi:hypothetical protein K2W90_00500 [Candidatus Babeliales bacterium]|nr:hypothetical protein [Candidatus Babeliales bacterium]
MKKKFFKILLVGLFFAVGNGYGAAGTTFDSEVAIINTLRQPHTPEKLANIDQAGNTYLTTDIPPKKVLGVPVPLTGKTAAEKQLAFQTLLSDERERLREFDKNMEPQSVINRTNLFMNLDKTLQLRGLAGEAFSEKFSFQKDTKKYSVPFITFVTNLHTFFTNFPTAHGKPYAEKDYKILIAETLDKLTAKSTPATPLDQLTASLTALKTKLATLATALNGLPH